MKISASKFAFFSLTLSLFFLVLPIFSYALANGIVNSAPACTKVGNPTSPLPTQCQTAGSNNDVVKAAQAIKDAYAACENGQTYLGLDQCMDSHLSASGYDAAHIAAYNQRRATSTVPPDCTECLGFVGTVLTLVTGAQNSLRYSDAASVANIGNFTVGNVNFKQVSSQGIQPGDIAIADSTAGFGVHGHIVVVKSVQGNVKFTGIESNWVPCTATDNVSHLNGQERNGSDIWNFYRAT